MTQYINKNEVITEDYCSLELEDASRNYADDDVYDDDIYFAIKAAFMAGAKWQKEHLVLTWEDINRIEIIIKDVYRDYPHGIEAKQFGIEVLNRFNKQKGK